MSALLTGDLTDQSSLIRAFDGAQPDEVYNLGAISYVAQVEVLYRVAAALVTDYSSTFIDFMLTGRPAVSFAYDYESYQLERGGFYDLDLCSPVRSARRSMTCVRP